jgi:hypothetical protein
MAVVQTAEEIIKIIQDKGLQRQFFELDYFSDYLYDLSEDDETTFDTVEEYLESVGLPTEFKKVDGRSDTSEFWSVIRFPVEDVYIKITGVYDSYGQREHYYNSKVTQVFPKQVTKIVYDKQ